MILALLVVAAFVAGLVDAIAGGGGLVTVPALFAAGLDPRIALATNKGQAIFGATSSFWAYARRGHVERARLPWSLAGACVGSLVGVHIVLVLDPSVLRPIVLALLVAAAALTFVRKPDATEATSFAITAPRFAALAIAFPLGAYDGFFGPGTGTFLILAHAFVFGDDLLRASANAKVANFASNVAAFVLFAGTGNIRWEIALPMGVAQLAGAQVGTHLAVKRGSGVVRGVVVAISLALAARVGWQIIAEWRGSS